MKRSRRMQLPTAPSYIPPLPSHIHPYTQRRDSPRTDASRHLLQQSRHILSCLPQQVCQKFVFLLRGMAVRAFALIRGVAPGAACGSDACCCRHFFCPAVVFGELLCLSFIGFLAARSVVMCLKGNAMLRITDNDSVFTTFLGFHHLSPSADHIAVFPTAQHVVLAQDEFLI